MKWLTKIAVFLFELGVDLVSEGFREKKRKKKVKTVGLSHQNLVHIQSQIKRATSKGKESKNGS